MRLRIGPRPLFRAASILMLCAGLAGMPARAANLLANPGFEAAGGSYAGWFTFGSGVQLSTPLTDNIMRSGVAAAKIYGQFTGCPGVPQFNVGGFGQAFTSVVVGREYELSGFAYVAGTDPLSGDNICAGNRLLAKIVFFSAATGGAEIQSNEIVIASGLTLADRWVPFTVASVAPVGALRVEALFLFLQPGCDPGSAFVDDVQFTEDTPVSLANSLANPSFSTPGFSGWSTFGNVIQDARTFAVHTRGGSAKLFSTFVPDAPSGMFQAVPASGGQNWEMSAWALNTCFESPVNGTNDNFVTAKIVFRDIVSAELGSAEIVLADKASPLGTWRKGTFSATAPPGTWVVEAYLLFVSPSLFGGAIWVDDVSLRRLDVVAAPVLPPATVLEVRPVAPNPFRDRASIDYSLPRYGQAKVAVYDVTGRHVVTLFEGEAEAGAHFVTWDGRAADGRLAPAGVYRAVVQTHSGRLSRAMVLNR